ncbi:hypothetical protein FOA52_003040 [Chlamydomonas sp. UWO 241]|nr:hypothetical protein FOA52_003040 [Chlamydomonas sp. UWO 241]
MLSAKTAPSMAGAATRRAAAMPRPATSRRAPKAARAVAASAASPTKEKGDVTVFAPSETSTRPVLPALISKEQVVALEAELDQGAAIAALRRFNVNLRNLPADRWEAVLTPVFKELCYNLESFNPAFTSCLLMVQRTIGVSDYERRDMALKNLIQPLAGEYGMHNSQPQLKTHRELFSDFFASLFNYPLEDMIASDASAPAAQFMWSSMSRDITSGGGRESEAMAQASYALGYNLAMEYLADYEKTWMLDSFRALDQSIFSGLGRNVDWVFLEVHAEGEAEHAVIGHNAVLSFVPSEHAHVMRQAMRDHDRDMAAFYNHAADLLEA